MMRNVFALVLTLALAAPPVALAQTFHARRMGMGGVILTGAGPGSEAANVAYRAVPAAPDSSLRIPLPIGLLPLLFDPPEFDPDDPDFNAYELANLLYNPPWNLQLTRTEPPSSDVTISIARNRLAVDLGEVSEVFPEDETRIRQTLEGPAITYGVGPFFGGLGLVSHVENDLDLNDALRGALRDGDAFQPLTTYQMFDDAEAQTAFAVMVGSALPVLALGDVRRAGTGLYAGARIKLLHGLALGRAENVVSFSTLDTLFASSPVDIGYEADLWDARPGDGRWGRALDLGLVWLGGGFEVGLGVNNLVGRLDWRARHSIVYEDVVASEYVQEVIARDVPYTTELPPVVTANAALRWGGVLLAADVVNSDAITLVHAGAETWLSNVAVRGGLSFDANEQVQASTGAGLRFGRIGVDVALATHSRNVTRERALELGAGLTLYPGGNRP